MDDDLLSFVISSKRRQETLLALSQQKMTVLQLSFFLQRSHKTLYRVVKELTDRELLAHNNVARNRIYRTTEKGKEILRFMGVI